MTTIEILNKWAEYTNYDPDQTRFNLMNGEWEVHRCNNNIQLISEYDPTGALSVMYAKSVCRKILQERRVCVFDAVSNPELLRESAEMWAIFDGKDVTAIEDRFVDTLDVIVRQIAGKQMLGERDRDAEKDALLRSVVAVVEELSKCNVDLFLRGGELKPIQKYSTHIHVFARVAECLLALEQADDGMYLCYVNNSGSADGYFGFYLKSNGNILSINERVNEAYPGQHKNSRNGRWSEEKKFRLFPYDYMFSYGDYDYKGYARNHIIDEEKLAFFNLTPEAYMPLVLAMVMLNTKYANTSTAEMPLKYTDAMLPVNAPELESSGTSLAVIQNSLVAQNHKALDIHMTSEDIITAAPAAKYNWSTNKKASYLETGTFIVGGNIFAELYGAGFELDAGRMLEANPHLKRLPTGNHKADDTPNAEFVGTEQRMGMAAYAQARQQFAEYIRSRIFEEYLAYGGVDAVKKWWKGAVRASRKTVIQMCVEKYLKEKSGEENNVYARGWKDASGNPLSFISFTEDTKAEAHAKYHPWEDYFLNEPHGYRGSYPDGKWLCCLNSRYTANMMFSFDFENWEQLAMLVGGSCLPKIVRGWKNQRLGSGNPLLDATDSVGYIGTPFERGEIYRNRRLWTRQMWSDYYWRHCQEYRDWPTREPDGEVLPQSPEYDFSFAVGFSRREFKKLLAEASKGDEQ